MKHIGIVVPHFPVKSETFVITEIKGLIKAGHKVTVFCFEHNSNIDVELPDGFQVVCLKAEKDIAINHLLDINPKALAKSFSLAYQQKQASRLSLWRYSVRLGLAAKQRQCEHLHSHFLGVSLAHTVVAGALFSIPVSAVGHGHDVYQTPTDLQVKLANCGFVVAVCKDMQAFLKNQTSQNVALLHCGVDTQRFAVHQAQPSSSTKLLFIGRLVEKKGLPYALQAIASLEPKQRPQLDIVGEGPEKQRLQQQVAELGLTHNVRFLGFRSPAWLQQQTTQYKALLAPFCEAANGDKDTGPVVLKEAMAMGLPVIATHFMGCKEIVDKESGWLVPPKSTAPLAEAISQLNALSPTRLLSMRQASRARVETHFCYLQQAKKLSNLIQLGGAYVSH